MAIRKHTFTLLNKKYELDVADQLEEVFRMGERRLNAQLLETMKEKTDGYDDRDYLARVALELATELICLESESRGEPDSEALRAMIEKIEATLK
ncbi:MAG: cell division protein ZapA [Alistipes sp.]|jgi:hypothetical protein|nr:cell division protein ZapA [Alistipes sp.]MBQ6583929.1 cell division protein ZapA [Alistipes sp.]MBR2115523.1 cell division protein ZapA [Alistipes sp.]MEE0915455.1 cell division protein ZapA [Alistipes sp.]